MDLAGIISPQMDWNASNLPEAWEKFERHAKLMFTGPLKGKSDEEHASYLLLWVGDKGRDIHHTWIDISAEDAKNTKTFFDKFKAHVQPKLNPIYARYKFYYEVQGEESIDSFLTRLRLMARDCNFHNNDEMIRDRLVFGTNSPKVRERLINVGSELTLDKAIQIGQSYEYSMIQLKQMSINENANEIHYVKGQKTYHRKGNPLAKSSPFGAVGGRQEPSTQRQSVSNRTTRVNMCGNCGRHHEKRDLCPAKGRTCNKCNKLNHFACVCRSVHEVQVDDYHLNVDEPEDFYIDTVTLKTAEPHLVLKLTQVLRCRHRDTHVTALFYVVETNAPPLLSLNTCIDLCLIKLTYSIDGAIAADRETGHKTDILKQFSDVFEGVGLFPGNVKLHLKPDAVLVVNPPRKVPVALNERFKSELLRMEEQEIITKVTVPTDWVNSIVVVEKPKTGQLRVCLDPKFLNEAIKRPYLPMRTIEDVVSQLSGATYFSVLDANSGYWSLKLEEESSYLTTFNTPFGRYCFLPFGVKCAQDEFQRKTDETFEGLLGVTAIVDYILIYGKTKSEHDINLHNVLTRARERGVRFNPEKCTTGVTEVRYFGHIISSEGLKPDPDKISCSVNMGPPKSCSELETMLGMVTYLTKFAPNLAEITTPLRALLKKDVMFSWDKPQQDAFDNIKHVITQAPVLVYFDQSKPVTLQVDASKHGLGAKLMQNGKPVAYASKSLTQSEIQYAQIEKEMLAIVFGCKRFHQFVYGREITVESDHKPLSSIMKKTLNAAPPRLQRIMLLLQQYDLDVTFVPGKLIPVADNLSRNFVNDSYPNLSDGLDLHVHLVISSIAMSDRTLQLVRLATENDTQFKTLTQTILDGWPDDKKNVPLPYWNIGVTEMNYLSQMISYSVGKKSSFL